MRSLFFTFTFIASIFSASHIYSAKKPKESVIFCNLPGKKIVPQDVNMPVDSISKQISLSDIKQFLESGCNKLVYTNFKGEELKVTNFVFAYTYKSTNQTFFEQTRNNRLTNSMIRRLKDAVPGDKIMIAVNGNEPIGAKVYTSQAATMYKVFD